MVKRKWKERAPKAQKTGNDFDYGQKTLLGDIRTKMVRLSRDQDVVELMVTVKKGTFPVEVKRVSSMVMLNVKRETDLYVLVYSLLVDLAEKKDGELSYARGETIEKIAWQTVGAINEVLGLPRPAALQDQAPPAEAPKKKRSLSLMDFLSLRFLVYKWDWLRDHRER